MIDLYYWPTPNGWKISIALEEMELPYNLVPVNIGRGEQFAPEFLAISPNNRMPAIVDHEPLGGGAPLAIFESGAILLYLAEKTGSFMPRDLRGRYEVTQWLMWQMGGLGPDGRAGGPLPPVRAGADSVRHRPLHQRGEPPLRRARHAARRQASTSAATTPSPTWRAGRGSSRTSDTASASKSSPTCSAGTSLMKTRPGVRRGFDVGKEIRQQAFQGMDEQARNVLFGQRARR